MRTRYDFKGFKWLFYFSALVFTACVGSKSNYEQEYARVWKETIKSEAWQASLNNNANPGILENESLYASSEEVMLNSKTGPNKNIFIAEKYNELVAEAYFKIIGEAERADKKLKEEYQRLIAAAPGSATSNLDKSDLNKAAKKYEAHNAMLSGLKSWNIMSEYGSDDLEFFKAEHREKVVDMIAENSAEEVIINFLVYKLADLYHFE